ncbi:MAG: 2-succinyl-5-enolpyruvyl-6-hydroxy-3-cyclohexene-1-carboxylic-acid synthase [Anaerolineae bacterium]|nr:2-succinyl-5-enolpyruvyl-6-hydroxy-3-cyclohexene-1-carboxylic-acid synthase [Anaerolineae bacterium]
MKKVHMDTGLLNTVWGRLIVEELVRNGVTYFVVSPGSRSTPLTAAVAGNPTAHAIIATDERGAAFHALGYARATGNAAALICTSGTAAANYLPAIIEADADRLPLLVLSADRPPELRDSGANQTIVQPGMFANYVRQQVDMPCPDVAIAPAFVLTTIDQAVYAARRQPAGPVHLNCMFRKPLDPVDRAPDPAYVAGIASWQAGRVPYTTYAHTVTAPSPGVLQALAGELNGIKRGVLVIGRIDTPPERADVAQLARKLNWPVFADITSGLRLGAELPNLIAYYDQILLGDAPQPDAVVHIGGQLVSSRYQQWVERVRPRQHILIAPHPDRHDPGHTVTVRYEAALHTLATSLTPHLSPSAATEWLEHWLDVNHRVNAILDTIQSEIGNPISEIAVARSLSRLLSAESALWLGSSMPIRDMDMFAAADGAAVPVAANRGASGIDGTLAAATGFAAGLDRPVTLLCGDLTFLHDLSSLTLLRHLSQPLIIIVINNQGGGIFHFLPIADNDAVFEPYFGTPHPYTFSHLAAAFDLDYHAPVTIAGFEEAYRSAETTRRHTLIEVRTERTINVSQHRALAARIQETLFGRN